MKTYLKYLSLTILGTFLISTVVYGATALFPTGGGTGKSSATAGDVGKVIKVLDDSPFTYEFATDNTGGSGTFPFSADTNYNQVVYSTSTPTLWFKSGLFASTTSYFKDIIATGYIDAPYFVATSTTATSTFAGGFAVETSGLVYDYSTNRVGIGIATPSSLLSLGTSVTDSKLLIYDGGGSDTYGFGISSSLLRIHSAGTSADIGFFAGASGSELMRIKGTGNVGIGTTSPYAKLSVEGSSALGNSATAGYFVATSTTATSTFGGGLKLGTTNMVVNSSGDLTILPVGEVLIGTTTQQASSRAFTIGNLTGFQFRVSTLGAITDGSYQATPVEVPYGGTGINLVTQGSVLFGNSSTALAQDNANFFWDNANNRLGIGNALPSQPLHVTGNGIITGGLQVGATANTTSGTAIIDGNFVGAINLVNGTIVTKTTLSSSNPPYSFVGDTNTGIGQFTLGADTLSIATGGLTRLTVDATGNIGIGTTTPYAKLSVVGETVASHFTATSTTATSTFQGGLYAYSPTATSTPYIYSKGTGFGGRLIMEDEGGGACTEITTKVGVVNARVISCPTEL